MPAKNAVKTYLPHTYYHVYNRGVAKQMVFLDKLDKQKFLQILSRHLDPDDTSRRKDGIPYAKFDDLELLCYCLMGNHFHLLFYVGDDETTLKQCMQQVTTAYSMYFNLRYKRVGPVFQGVYKASMILDEAYLLHITRYIHMNPRRYLRYDYSSIKQYLGSGETPGFLKPNRMLELFAGGAAYGDFLADHEEYRDVLTAVKQELAGY